jgi:hypothetical protein
MPFSPESNQVETLLLEERISMRISSAVKNWIIVITILVFVGILVATVVGGIGLDKAVTVGKQVDALVIPVIPDPPVDTDADVFLPDRTLFVAKSWGSGYKSPVFFTNISAALLQAAIMSPSNSSRILILVYTGEYAEDVVLVSGVTIKGFRDAVNITGAVSWNAGSGVNAGQKDRFEIVDLVHLIIDGSVTTNTTSKTTASETKFDGIDCKITGSITMTLRPSTESNDFVFIDTFRVDGAGTFSGGFVTTQDMYTTGALNTKNHCSWKQYGHSQIGAVLFNQSLVIAQHIRFRGNVVLDQTTFMVADGCIFPADIAVCDFCLIDLRTSRYTTLSGTGLAVRDRVFYLGASASAGTNTVAISPPLPTTNYMATFSQTNNVTCIHPRNVQKSGSSFTYWVDVGGCTFDILLNVI